MLVWLAGSVVVAVIVGAMLGRRAVWVGLAVLLLGLGPMAALWVYETHFYTKGDTSDVGMLATLAALLLGPPGVILVLVGLVKVE
jgi:hypothetical protein